MHRPSSAQPIRADASETGDHQHRLSVGTLRGDHGGAGTVLGVSALTRHHPDRADHPDNGSLRGSGASLPPCTAQSTGTPSRTRPGTIEKPNNAMSASSPKRSSTRGLNLRAPAQKSAGGPEPALQRSPTPRCARWQAARVLDAISRQQRPGFIQLARPRRRSPIKLRRLP